MKKLFAITLCAVMLLSLLVSCDKQQAGTPDQGKYSEYPVSYICNLGGADPYYNDRYLSFNGALLTYRYLDGDHTDYDLCFSATCTHKFGKCPARVLVSSLYVVDHSVDSPNPPIYMSSVDLEKSELIEGTQCTIICIKPDIGEVKQVCEVPAQPVRMFICGDYVYFDVYEGDLNKHTEVTYYVSKNGGEAKRFIEGDTLVRLLFIINGNYIYQTTNGDDSERYYIASKRDLSDGRPLVDDISGGQLYTTGHDYILREGGKIYKLDPENTSNYTYLGEIGAGKYIKKARIDPSSNRMYFVSMDDMKTVGYYIRVDYFGKEWKEAVHDYDHNQFGYIDLDTGEITLIDIPFEGAYYNDLFFAHDDYVSLSIHFPYKTLEQNEEVAMHVIYNAATGEFLED